jgi:probable H4MPT-linked C1 transfer pathway protein
MAQWIGLDVGGANLKMADTRELAIEVAFPLWKERDGLVDALRSLLGTTAADADIALTMTGELADCYATKREGVAHITRAVEEAARGRRIAVYLVDGSFVAPSDAIDRPYLAAASNWHALATLVARHVIVGTGLLADIGSTTTDLIPLAGGRAIAHGTNDTERLLHGELVYSGVARTPICAIVAELPYRGAMCSVAAELFAATADAYLLLGDTPDRPGENNTADGRPATQPCARDRMARMICADRETFTADDAAAAARAVAAAQLRQLQYAAERVIEASGRPETIVLSGQGESLGRQLTEVLGFTGRVVSLAERLGDDMSRVAPAHAVARLAQDHFSS